MRNVFYGILAVGALFSIGVWGVYFQFPQGSAPLVLHFRVGSGADLLGARDAIRTIPLLASTIFLVNLGLALVFRKRDAGLSLLFPVVTVLLELFFLLALTALLLANQS